MKRILPTILFIVTFVPSVGAVGPNPTKTEERKEMRQEIKEAASKARIIAKIKGTKAAVLGGKIESLNAPNFTVSKDGNTYTVNTDSKTVFRRKYWGKSAFNELQIGDTVNIHGKYAAEDKTTIQAVLIRDLSIQKRYGVFFGTVESVSQNTLILNTASSGKQTVTVSSSSRLINRKEQRIKLSDIGVGHLIRVKGLWNNTSNTITEVREVKDFSIPVVPSPTK